MPPPASAVAHPGGGGGNPQGRMMAEADRVQGAPAGQGRPGMGKGVAGMAGGGGIAQPGGMMGQQAPMGQQGGLNPMSPEQKKKMAQQHAGRYAAQMEGFKQTV